MSLGNNYPSLQGKTVFISGGASGIGANLVSNFHAQGAVVHFVDIADAAGQQLCASLNEASGREVSAHYHRCDVTDVGCLGDIVRSIGQASGIDVLVNNAANDARHEVTHVDETSWDACLGVNLKHQFFAAQAALESMRNTGGSIINMGSISWRTSTVGMVGYTTSKAAVEGLTRSLARDFGRYNIRVNTLIPGWVMTQKQLREHVDDDAKHEIQVNQCLSDQLLPQDISAMALFLASDDAKMCTNQCFVVDGGWS